MNDLTVNTNVKPGEISFNLDELKKNLSEEMDHYKNLVVSEDSLKADKKDLAMLRKAYKELNDRKVAVKKAFMEPYTKFEDEVKEALEIINEPISIIDKQIKVFEEEQKKAKLEYCRNLFEENVGDLGEYITFEKVFNEKWLNVSTKGKDIIEDISIFTIRVKNDLNAISALGSEIESELLSVYKRTGELSAAIQKNTDYINTKALAEKRLAEEKAKEEEKAEKVAEEVLTETTTFEQHEEPMCFETERVATTTFTVMAGNANAVRNFLKFSQIWYQEN